MKRFWSLLRFRARIVWAVLAAFLISGAIYFVPAEGNDNMPKHILLRLEDVGPGGQYGSAEQLGKLRAVMRMLQERDVRYQIAVIPRWVNVAKDGTRYDVSIDQLDNDYISLFDGLLHSAVRSGAVLGMHGYTHQVGDTFREDGHQESGIGNEFYVPDVKETLTPQFASLRVEQGAETFRRAGLFPYFWEAPHYHTLPVQDAVFRSYFGLNFQADVQLNRNALYPQYSMARNEGFGASSLGSIYVPTPLSYIPYNRDVDIITNQLGKSDKLPALFFHPFLEFKHLIAVTDELGEPVIEDGLPLYRYPAEEKSPLQKLLPRLAAKGYRFMSLTDYIPFVPAHSVKVGTGKERSVELGDVTGKGQTDIVMWDKMNSEIVVTEGQFRGLRNEAQLPPKVWCKLKFGKGDVWTLFDGDFDGKSDLWIMRANGTMEMYRSNGSEFVLSRSWNTNKRGWANMLALKKTDKEWIIAGESSEGSELESFVLRRGELVPMASRPWDRNSPVPLTVGDLDGDGNDSLYIPFPHSSRWIELTADTASLSWKRNVLRLTIPTGEDGVVYIGDFNGDGKQDICFWNAEEKKLAVYQQTGALQFELLSRMGPWGHADGRLLVRDLNGDGKMDIAELSGKEAYVDMAMSYQSKRPAAATLQ